MHRDTEQMPKDTKAAFPHPVQPVPTPWAPQHRADTSEGN